MESRKLLVSAGTVKGTIDCTRTVVVCGTYPWLMYEHLTVYNVEDFLVEEGIFVYAKKGSTFLPPHILSCLADFS